MFRHSCFVIRYSWSRRRRRRKIQVNRVRMEAMQVLFIGASVGAGHNQAATAIMAALKARAPHLQAEFIDALEYTARWFRPSYRGLYQLGFVHFPRIYGWSYHMLNRPRGLNRTLSERIQLWTERLAMRRLRRHILDRSPKLVVATHYLPSRMLGWLIGHGPSDLRMWVVVTDTEAHRFWYAENVQEYFVPNEQVAQTVRSWDMPGAGVTASGIPVHPKWTAPLDAKAILTQWKLPADRPIVLLNGGAYFSAGPTERIARRLLAETPAHVVVLAGSNKKLLAKLAALSGGTDRLTAAPFTDKVHELAPMVLTRPVPGQEAANAATLVAEGVAVMASDVAEVIEKVAALIGSPEALHALRTNARRVYLPAAETIADRIAQTLDQ